MQKNERIQRKVKKQYREIYDQHDTKHIQAFEKQRLRRKRKKQRRRRALVAFTVIFTLVIAYALAPISKISIVNVFDNKTLSQEQIIDMSGLVSEQSSYAFLFKPIVERRMEKSPYISSVDIERGRGRQIDLHVKERQIIFSTIVNEQTIVYFADGTSAPLENQYVLDVTLLHGIGDTATFNYTELAQQFGIVPKEITSKISEIIAAPTNIDPERYTLLMADGNRINITKQNIATHLKYYNHLLQMTGDTKYEFDMDYVGEGEERPVPSRPIS